MPNAAVAPRHAAHPPGNEPLGAPLDDGAGPRGAAGDAEAGRGDTGTDTDTDTDTAFGDPVPHDPETGAPQNLPDPEPVYPEGVRYQVRWGQSGLCDIPGLEDVAATRAAVHASFAATTIGGIDLRYDATVPTDVLATVADAVPEAESMSRLLVGYSPAPPTIYVYADLEQLRSAACVNRASVAYYDGDLHVTGDFANGLDQIHKSVIHEYIHHALLSWGIGEPQWLQEGLAMYAAQETWWQDPELGLVAWLRTEHLPFYLMNRAFPHTADELFAGAAYYQSFRMVAFVVWLHGQAAITRLTADLARGGLAATDAFASACGLSGADLEATWSEYLGQR